ncbi:hypothetical protein LOAG_12132 [Loa loa]|uniref:Uncharacterized protein n=1 Tax=Loa loa TaxID=7209 RepID=A0A1S0TMA8_LOALO|nr:hypothetical protein LOAG_12132 [Loa loa]EFO16375.1 hypothetical protein LOAG_12132 [Loa loa]
MSTYDKLELDVHNRGAETTIHYDFVLSMTSGLTFNAQQQGRKGEKCVLGLGHLLGSKIQNYFWTAIVISLDRTGNSNQQ